MQVAYIIGPYRAKSTYQVGENIARARRAACHAWQRGFAVICPHLNSAHMDGLVADVEFLKGDHEILRRCDLVIRLDNWQTSEGSKAELELARLLHKPIFDYTEWHRGAGAGELDIGRLYLAEPGDLNHPPTETERAGDWRSPAQREAEQRNEQENWADRGDGKRSRLATALERKMLALLDEAQGLLQRLVYEHFGRLARCRCCNSALSEMHNERCSYLAWRVALAKLPEHDIRNRGVIDDPGTNSGPGDAPGAASGPQTFCGHAGQTQGTSPPGVAPTEHGAGLRPSPMADRQGPPDQGMNFGEDPAARHGSGGEAREGQSCSAMSRIAGVP